MARRGRSIGIMAPVSTYRPPPRARSAGRKGWSELDLIALAALGYAGVREAWVAFACAAVLVVLIWVAFVRPTVCDVENKNGRGSCENTAYGVLRACHRPAHRRAKRDALCAYLRLPNPARWWRMTWSRRAGPTGRRSPVPGAAAPTLARPLYDGIMLVATVVSAIATVAALALQS